LAGVSADCVVSNFCRAIRPVSIASAQTGEFFWDRHRGGVELRRRFRSRAAETEGTPRSCAFRKLSFMLSTERDRKRKRSGPHVAHVPKPFLTVPETRPLLRRGAHRGLQDGRLFKHATSWCIDGNLQRSRYCKAPPSWLRHFSMLEAVTRSAVWHRQTCWPTPER